MQDVADSTDSTDAMQAKHQLKSKTGRAKALCLGAACFNEAWKALYDQVVDSLGATPGQKSSSAALWASIHKDKYALASMLEETP